MGWDGAAAVRSGASFLYSAYGDLHNTDGCVEPAGDLL